MKVMKGFVLNEGCDSEYSAGNSGTLLGEQGDESKEFLSGLPDDPGHGLELGCWGSCNRHLIALARKGYSLSGVDIGDSTAQSRKQNPWLMDLNFQQTDILSYIPACTGYDAFVCFEVLLLFIQGKPQQVTSTIISAVKPDSYVFLDLSFDLTHRFQSTGDSFIFDK